MRYFIPREYTVLESNISRIPFTIIYAKSFSKLGSITSECRITIARLLRDEKLRNLIYKILSISFAATTIQKKHYEHCFFFCRKVSIVYSFPKSQHDCIVLA